MHLKRWFKNSSPDKRKLIADKANTTVKYLGQIVNNHSRPSITLQYMLIKLIKEIDNLDITINEKQSINTFLSRKR